MNEKILKTKSNGFAALFFIVLNSLCISCISNFLFLNIKKKFVTTAINENTRRIIKQTFIKNMSGALLKIFDKAPVSPCSKFGAKPINLSIKSVNLISAIPAMVQVEWVFL